MLQTFDEKNRDLLINIDGELVHRDAARISPFDSVVQGVFTVPGDGDIDFGPIFKALDDKGYEGWLEVEAEQDPAKANPLEYAIKTRNYLRELLNF